VIHDTGYPGITLYHTNGNGAPNVIERNLVWNSGDNGIQVTGDAIVRNNIVLSAAAAGIGIHASQGGSVQNLVTMIANVGTGSLSGVSGGFDASGDIAADFSDANYSGAPPQDLVPRVGRLVGTGDAGTLAADDFNAESRLPAIDVGAYRNNPAGNQGWPLQAGFKQLSDAIFADGFDSGAGTQRFR
jgi:hypothetical protein